MGRLGRVHDVISAAENIAGAAERLGESVENRKKDQESGMREYYSQETDRYWKKTKRILLFSVILWIFFIVATAVLCVQGNDIVLRWISL